MKPSRVLVFDSGLGGLSVAGCIRRTLPALELVYLADNARFPYGDQAEETVVEHSVQLMERTLAAYPADMVVVACNTASTVVLPELRQRIAVPVVGVVPAIKPAAQLSDNRCLGLLATPATIRRPYLDQLVADYAADCQLTRIGHPQLVRWIEQWVGGADLPLAQLDQALAPFRSAEVDTVVLGCTHYPLISEALRSLLPTVRYWLDSGDAIARRVAYLLGMAPTPEQPVVAQPLVAALFTGAVPTGVVPFMAGLDLAGGPFLANWQPEPA
ncbi:glutamate racemase [Marinobacter xestospongiae]|uniref:Glutamate racemase n=1 Tax=Marinobacter xestospongiae TaxID=994319 RepID=A0ABU3VSS1_9GAMM|nr:glutamate racemase [Marinobacter xestospongiae]MDV2077304.1 glutamate racemase [Marinobacter xestospongiae]